MGKYSFLEQIQIGSKVLKNRIIMSSQIKSLCTEDGFVTDDYVSYYKERARGGASMIIPGAMIVDPDWPYNFYRQPRLNDDKYIPGLKRAIESVQAEGALFICQLWHSGLYLKPDGTRGGKSVNDLTLTEIHELQEKFVSAALRAKKAGADGVEFHCAHCYLPNQFLSPYFNKRTDMYGSGTIENATRFSTDILKRIKKEMVDDNFILIAKINGNDFVEGGTTPQWAAQAGALFEKAGVSMITVNGGGSLTKLIGMSDDGREAEGWKIPFAIEMKRKVSIPVAANGDLRHPEFIDKGIKDGKYDVAAIGRGLLADPHWVKKVIDGREDDIRHCISCMCCFNFNNLRGESCCSFNPYAARELHKPIFRRNGNNRNIVVVGAGPAGLETAITLAKRGFSVLLFEASEKIGGQLALAMVAPGKHKLGWMSDYFQKQIHRLGVKLYTNKSVSAENVIAMAPYAVVVATGSEEIKPPIEGMEYDITVGVRDILENEKSVISGKKVVVLGGGLSGIETARFLHQHGNEVTVVEMQENPGVSREAILAAIDCREEGIPVLLGHKVLRIREDGCAEIVRIADNEIIVLRADLFVRAFGAKANDRLYNELKSDIKRLYKVGDCDEPGKIYSAIEKGNRVACAID
jgi:2,4-dienoyl-CoA reductase-like NADH-dependent reductase (Old Yellow Enzyme family)/thioredoxin reductase